MLGIAVIPPGKCGGDKRTVITLEMVNGFMYILSTGCQWRVIPKDLPPRSTLCDCGRRCSQARRIAMICSSVNRLCFMSAYFVGRTLL
jgi:transposase